MCNIFMGVDSIDKQRLDRWVHQMICRRYTSILIGVLLLDVVFAGTVGAQQCGDLGGTCRETCQSDETMYQDRLDCIEWWSDYVCCIPTPTTTKSKPTAPRTTTTPKVTTTRTTTTTTTTSIPCPRRDERCALTLESDYRRCCRGLDCLLTEIAGLDAGVCCYPGECVIGETCVAEGWLRYDKSVCENGSWVLQNETSIEKTSHWEAFISYERACVDQPVEIQAEDEEGKPLKNAIYSIRFNESPQGYGVVNEEGEFNFTPRGEGTYSIEIMSEYFSGVHDVEAEFCETTPLEVYLYLEKEVAAGEGFNAIAEVHAKKALNGVKAILYLPEDFLVEDPVIEEENKIERGEIKILTWRVETAESLSPGNYTLKVEAYSLTEEENISDSKEIEVIEERDIIEKTLNTIYEFIENISEIILKNYVWSILLLILLILVSVYYRNTQRYP